MPLYFQFFNMDFVSALKSFCQICPTNNPMTRIILYDK